MRDVRATELGEWDYEQVQKLVEPIAAALGQLDIRKYDLIVGDDTSGRIPSLVVRRVANRVNDVLGRKRLPILFIQSYFADDISWSRKGVAEARVKQRERLFEKSGRPNRALVVTEYISGGEHIRQIGNELTALGIPFDVLAVGSGLSEDRLKSYGKGVPEGSRLYAGGRDCILYQAPHLTGLSREKYSPDPVLTDPDDRRTMSSMRSLIDDVADDVSSKLGEKYGFTIPLASAYARHSLAASISGERAWDFHGTREIS